MLCVPDAGGIRTPATVRPGNAGLFSATVEAADMDQRTPPTVGLVVSLVVLGVVAGPLFVLSNPGGLETYYASGLVGAWGVALLALVAVVAFAAGRQRRTEPDTVAGATLVVGVAMVLLGLQWALAVDPVVLQSSTTAAWMANHRWAVVATSLGVPAVAVWYARAIGVL